MNVIYSVKVLAIASKKGLSGTSVRIGQICGASKTGSWNVSDWVPIIVKSGVKIGSLPALEGVCASSLVVSDVA